MQVKVKLNEVKFLFRTLSNFEAFGGHLTVIYIELVPADFPYCQAQFQFQFQLSPIWTETCIIITVKPSTQPTLPGHVYMNQF